MLTAQFEPWLRVTAYLVAIGLTLEVAHRVYHAISRRGSRLSAPPVVRALVVALATFIPLISASVVTGLFCMYVDRASLNGLGLYIDRNPATGLISGFLISFFSITAVFMIGRASGWFRVQSSRLSGELYKDLPTFCGGFSDFVNSSIFEELIMRGYVFSLLYNRLGVSSAVLGSSALFSLFHLIKHARLPILFTVNAFLFGVLAAQTRLITGALWMPIGLHAGWNLTSASIYGLPFAGRLCSLGLITCAVDGPEYITGGYYSPGAGLLGTVALGFATLALVVVTRGI